MLTKAGAKLLDFGLAKSSAPVVAVSGTMAPTTPPNITAQGTILGTFQYMAPEQIEGIEADARTDVFAFGCVLFEMLTGKKAFEGKTRASLIGAILKDEPPRVSTVQPLAPASLDRIVSPVSRKTRTTAIKAHAICCAISSGSLGRCRRAGARDGEDAPVRRRPHVGHCRRIVDRHGDDRFLRGAVSRPGTNRRAHSVHDTAAAEHDLRAAGGRRDRIAPQIAVSPDGRSWPSSEAARAAISCGSDRSQASTRAPLPEQRTPCPVLVTRQPLYRLFCERQTEESACGRWTARGDLRRRRRARRHVESRQRHHLRVVDECCSAFQQGAAFLRRPPLSTMRTARAASTGFRPSCLTGGTSSTAKSQGRAARLPSRGGSGSARSIPWTRRRFFRPNPRRRSRRATCCSIGAGRSWRSASMRRRASSLATRFQSWSTSDTKAAGTRASRPPTPVSWFPRSGSAQPNTRLTWMDRAGRQLGTIGEAAKYQSLALSSDERRVAVAFRAARLRIWTSGFWTSQRGTQTRLTFDAGFDNAPVWSPDDLRILFQASREGFPAAAPEACRRHAERGVPARVRRRGVLCHRLVGRWPVHRLCTRRSGDRGRSRHLGASALRRSEAIPAGADAVSGT